MEILFLKCLWTGSFEWASMISWTVSKHGINRQFCSASPCLPVQLHILVRQSHISMASWNWPCQKSIWYNIKIIFREIKLFKGICHKGSSNVLQLRCWGSLDHPFLALALLTVRRLPESIRKKAILFRWLTNYTKLNREDHWLPI